MHGLRLAEAACTRPAAFGRPSQPGSRPALLPRCPRRSPPGAAPPPARRPPAAHSLLQARPHTFDLPVLSSLSSPICCSLLRLSPAIRHAQARRQQHRPVAALRRRAAVRERGRGVGPRPRAHAGTLALNQHLHASRQLCSKPYCMEHKAAVWQQSFNCGALPFPLPCRGACRSGRCC